MKRQIIAAAAAVATSVASGCAGLDANNTKVSVSKTGAQVEVAYGGKRSLPEIAAKPPAAVSDPVVVARYDLLKVIVQTAGSVAIEYLKTQSHGR